MAGDRPKQVAFYHPLHIYILYITKFRNYETKEQNIPEQVVIIIILVEHQTCIEKETVTTVYM